MTGKSCRQATAVNVFDKLWSSKCMQENALIMKNMKYMIKYFLNIPGLLSRMVFIIQGKNNRQQHKLIR